MHHRMNGVTLLKVEVLNAITQQLQQLFIFGNEDSIASCKKTIVRRGRIGVESLLAFGESDAYVRERIQ
jgi:hypothetical protein